MENKSRPRLFTPLEFRTLRLRNDRCSRFLGIYFYAQDRLVNLNMRVFSSSWVALNGQERRYSADNR